MKIVQPYLPRRKDARRMTEECATTHAQDQSMMYNVVDTTKGHKANKSQHQGVGKSCGTNIKSKS